MNINKELEKYNLTPELYEQMLEDCSKKVGQIVDLDWSEINEKYKLKLNPDTIRKACTPLMGGVMVKEYYEQKYAIASATNKEGYAQELKSLKEEIFKEKRKLYDQRREYNKLLTSDARAEHLNDELVQAAYKLNEEKPLIFEEKWFKPNIHKEAVLCWADWHYGMVTNNIWNEYNTEICRQRVKQLVEITKDFLKLNNIDVLTVLTLGDAAHGSIHTGCRVRSEEDTCTQLMHVSELMAEAINELSKVVNHINVYSCYGNHMRTIQNKTESIHSDNMEKVIPWWLKQRLQNNTKVEIIESEYKEFTKINILGSHICAVHGDLEKDFKKLGVTINTIFDKKFGESIDYTISADKHHVEEFEQIGIKSILVPCLCGTDDFANDKRLYSDPGQTLIIFNDVYGRESTYHIPLK